MFIIMMIIIITFFIVFMLKFISMIISEKVFFNRENLTSYECGFEHQGLSRLPFSFRYFFLTLIFLLFDLEIILLLFIPHLIMFNYNFLAMFVTLMFIIFLFVGLMFEWKESNLDWVM